MRPILLTLLFYISLIFGQDCPLDINGPNNNTNPQSVVTYYVYDEEIQLLDSVDCNQAGTSNNVNCRISNIDYEFEYIISSDGCIYDTNGLLIQINLPVEVIDFKVDCDSIRWTTLSENNNSHFILFYSEDGLEWEYYNLIMGANVSNNRIEYKSVNNNPSGYYKLIQYDFNGDNELIGYVKVNLCDKKELIYPNPVTNFLHLDPNCEYIIYNSIGSVVDIVIGVRKYTFNHARGSYIIHNTTTNNYTKINKL